MESEEREGKGKQKKKKKTVPWDVSLCRPTEMYLLFGVRTQKTASLFFKLTALSTSKTSKSSNT